MGKVGDDEATLVAEAERVLAAERPDDVEVLAAGVFGLQDLVYAQAAGNVAGGLLADGATGAVAAGVGGRIAKEAAADAAGVTLQLLVAVTPSTISVLNRDPGSGLAPVVLELPRSSTEVTIKRFGLSRLVHLHDLDSGAEVTLHASAAPFRAQSKADAVVLHLLAAP